MVISRLGSSPLNLFLATIIRLPKLYNEQQMLRDWSKIFCTNFEHKSTRQVEGRAEHRHPPASARVASKVRRGKCQSRTTDRYIDGVIDSHTDSAAAELSIFTNREDCPTEAAGITPPADP
ncbi:hypothetical protein J6590_066448 [Homalodisca vitripennis]|nr:hypothetical protein J6590_066448 [Homalodisca vitripennis]